MNKTKDDIKKLFAKKPKELITNDSKLEFDTPAKEADPIGKEEYSEISTPMSTPLLSEKDEEELNPL